MYKSLETMEENQSDRFESILDMDLNSDELKEVNENLTMINKEKVSEYLKLKSKEVTTLIIKHLADADAQRREQIAKQKQSTANSRIQGSHLIKEKQEMETPPQIEFIQFLSTFVSYIKNLNLMAANCKALGKQSKVDLESILKLMESHLSNAYTTQKWIFKETEPVYLFLKEYFNLLNDIQNKITILNQGKGGVCCSSTVKKDLETKISLLESKIFAFPILFQLEPRKLAILNVIDNSVKQDIELAPINFTQENISKQVQGILNTQFPNLSPLYKLKVETVFERVPQPTERIVHAAPPVLKEPEPVKTVPKISQAKESFYGYMRSKDYVQAFHLFTGAEQEGCYEASIYLGKMYLEGLGVRKNTEKAFQHFTKAHINGLPEGTYQLAKLIEKNSSTGNDKEKDLKTAFDLYQKAAEANHSEALTDLGFIHEKGILGFIDLVKAEAYYNQAISLGNPRAMNNLASLLLNHPEKERSLNQSKKIFELFDRAAKSNYPLALTNLGICYLRGIYVSQDYIAARQLFRESAEMNEADGLFYTAYFLLKESNLTSSETNYQQSANLLRKVLLINENHADALYYLGYLYENGLGVDQDHKTAFKYYNESMNASNEQDGKPLYKIATMLYTGQGTNFVDKEKALTLYLKAANLGDPDALYILGVLHEEGVDVEQNIQLATEFYKKSAKLGHADAQLNLGLLMLDQRDSNNYRTKQSNVPVLLQTYKSNGNDETGDEIELSSPEKLITDAAKQGNLRAQKLLGTISSTKPNEFSHISKILKNELRKENNDQIFISNTFHHSYLMNKENDRPKFLLGKGALNNYMRV